MSERCIRVMLEISSLALATPSHVADVFVEWAAHVGAFKVRVFRGGWTGLKAKADWQADLDAGRMSEAKDYATLLLMQMNLKDAIKEQSK